MTSYDKIEQFAGENNNLQFEMYYPNVNYQPMNKSNPIFIKYTNYFYHLSRFSNKIDRLYLKQHKLKDDEGFITNNIKTYSYWGISSLNGDSYSIGNKKDLMNEVLQDYIHLIYTHKMKLFIIIEVIKNYF